ncbi:MAG: hypothetical protein AVDCRST_MAG59-1837 [uncultured Thermomicrobiales bacterium]|uniref:Uncharacterized protein n=1 Tax=uncultured Thermomicrobiales bacterium TaxID=1645740 RepID=A0A6J4UMT0_9BACT|nr:MAG: hypothetical protein AVDCRST_MAG59-1837 [uncultured Thermomicrobiales bacterium]
MPRSDTIPRVVILPDPEIYRRRANGRRQSRSVGAGPPTTGRQRDLRGRGTLNPATIPLVGGLP